MRRKPLLFLGLGAILLVPAYGLTQIPSGSGGNSGKGKSDFRSRFGGGMPAAPGTAPGSAPGQPGTQPSGGSPSSPGSSFSRGSMGRGSGEPSGPAGEMPDPSKLFYTFSQGRDTVRRDDLPPPLQAMFDRTAQQLGAANGQMNRQQFEAMMQGAAALRQPEAATPDRMARFGEDFFRRQDRNGDGLLNFDEMSDALKGERDKWDMNRDGFIDLNEYASYFQGRMQQQMQERSEPSMAPGYYPPPPPEDDSPRPEEPKPVVYRAGKLPKELPSWFAQMDTDGDAQIGLYEWKSGSKPFEEFRNYDVNDDGFVTIAEVLRVNNQNQNAKTGTAVASNGNGGGRSSSGQGGQSGSSSGLGNIFGMFGRRPSGTGAPSSGAAQDPRSGGGSQDPRSGGRPAGR